MSTCLMWQLGGLGRAPWWRRAVLLTRSKAAFGAVDGTRSLSCLVSNSASAMVWPAESSNAVSTCKTASLGVARASGGALSSRPRSLVFGSAFTRYVYMISLAVKQLPLSAGRLYSWRGASSVPCSAACTIQIDGCIGSHWRRNIGVARQILASSQLCPSPHFALSQPMIGRLTSCTRSPALKGPSSHHGVGGEG